jgi:hypothetical protein
MNKTTALLPLVAGLLLAGSAQARQDPTQEQAQPSQAPPATACPQLPANAGLAWEARSTADSDFCRALRSDGSEAFGLYITAQPSFEPNPRNGKESGRIDGRSVVWYRAEIATDPGVQARETLLQLADGRYAHIWLQADSADALAIDYQLVGSLRFRAGGSGEQVAGN